MCWQVLTRRLRCFQMVPESLSHPSPSLPAPGFSSPMINFISCIIQTQHFESGQSDTSLVVERLDTLQLRKSWYHQQLWKSKWRKTKSSGGRTVVLPAPFLPSNAQRDCSVILNSTSWITGAAPPL